MASNDIETIKSQTINMKMSMNFFKDNNVYLFVGKDSPWDDEENPDLINDSIKSAYSVYDNMLALKKVLNTQTRSVVRRIDWEPGRVYDYYRHDVDMINSLNSLGNRYDFYVLTDENHVYKCLSNGGGVESTTKPVGQVTDPFETDDGYIWKYMFTVKDNDEVYYLTRQWIPVYTLDHNDNTFQWIVQETSVKGSIDYIHVESTGVGYRQENPPEVVITGDGTGCQAEAIVNSEGGVEKIRVLNSGEGYTNASVNIVDSVGVGTGSSATPILSPYDGHGSDPINELGAHYIMIKMYLFGDEQGVITAETYRQVGIIINPKDVNTFGSTIHVDNSNFYSIGDTITGQTSSTTGTVNHVDRINDILYVETTGNYIQQETITNGTYQTNAVVVRNNEHMMLTNTVVDPNNIYNKSGDLAYISNRNKVTRDPQQTEGITLIMKF